MKYDVVIIGAGPAGLACARQTAKCGLRTLVVEKNVQLGTKVCTGGVTWNGLIQRIPETLAEKVFKSQVIRSPLQTCTIRAHDPMIATVDRQRLGMYLAEQAKEAGAEIQTGVRLRKIQSSGNDIVLAENGSGPFRTLRTNYLVGADGAASIVRRHLKLPVENFGIGIHCQVPGEFPDMVWYLSPKRFRNGYGWVFPHRQRASIGVYASVFSASPRQLQRELRAWLTELAIPPATIPPLRAEKINYDYRGWRSNNIMLAGDAAGLSSALTGEGIYPAIVSGEYIGKSIGGDAPDVTNFNRLLRNHRLHRIACNVTAKFPFFTRPFLELLVLGLRTSLLDFSSAEMAR